MKTKLASLRLYHRLANRRVLLFLALLIAVAAAAWLQWERIADPFTIQDDFRKFHWMYRNQDPTLFADDPLTSPQVIRLGPLRFFTDRTHPGYSFLFFLASPLFSPVLFNKLLIFPLLLLSTYLLFRIGEIIKDSLTGFALALAFVVLTWVSASATSVAAGLPRSFMPLIIIGIVYYLMSNRFWLATGIALVGATVYLPAAVLGLGTILLAFIRPEAKRGRYHISWRLVLPLVAFIAILFLFFPSLLTNRAEILWNSLLDQSWSLGELLSDPDYVSGGRFPLFRDFPFLGLGALGNNFPTLWSLLMLTPLALAVLLLVPASYRQFPRSLTLLFLASIILFSLSWLTILITSTLLLYFPSRYTHFSLGFVLLVYVVVNMGTAIRLYWERLRNSQRLASALIIVVWLMAALTLSILMARYELWNRFGLTHPSWRVILPATYAFFAGSVFLVLATSSTTTDSNLIDDLATKERRLVSVGLSIMIALIALIVLPRNDHHYFTIDPQTADLVSFFKTTPKDSLAAGDPCSLDYVPIAAKRQVLTNCEYFSPNAANRAMDMMRAYYAGSLSQVLDFCAAYGVDYFVVDPRRFKLSEDPWIFFEPYNSILQPEVLAQPGFVLEEIPAASTLYSSDAVSVMNCADFELGRLSGQSTAADGLHLLAYEEIARSMTQTDAGVLEVTIKWMADQEIGADHDVCFSLKRDAGETASTTCEPVSSQVPTSQWQIPEIRYEDYGLEIAPYLESGDYSIVASVEAAQETSRDGQEQGGNDFVIGRITYSALPRTFAAANSEPASSNRVIWGDAIGLADFEIDDADTDVLNLAVRWHALQRMDESYKFFAHLRRAGTNEIVSQVDTIPREWTYPTSWWEKNEIVTDTLSISLDGVGPGQYELWIGFYDEMTGERLPLSDIMDSRLPTREQAVMIHELES
ncbi:MAG: hypothetical protein R3300_03245 [Candidatus Promineifilaceae bacterium]|nr:hypothetical protein [Candidatus Promineifilaceae bacterium]